MNIFNFLNLDDKISLSQVNKYFRTSCNLVIPNDEQLLFFDEYERGKNIILTACAGTGKSYCIHVLSNKYKKILITATTGFAANLIKGHTIDYVMKYIEMVHDFKDEFIDFSGIVIDEASMMGEIKLLNLDVLLRSKFDCSKPFGGKQIILCGDFLQLPPVLDKLLLFSRYLNSMNFTLIYLRKIYRQNDHVFISVLNKIRNMKLDSDSLNFLYQLQDNQVEGVTLVATNAEAKKYNNAGLDKLPGEPIIYNRHGTPYAKRSISTRLPKKLRLKVGAFVILLYNIDKKAGLVNGSQGIVVDFKEGFPVINFGHIVKKIGYYVDNHCVGTKIDYSDAFIDDILKNADDNTFMGYSTEWIKVKQLPLRLSWAITVHKSQGLSLDNMIIDCTSIKFNGQFYTAISRARDHNKIKLINFSKRCVKSDIRILYKLYQIIKNNPNIKTFENERNEFYEAKIWSLNDVTF